MAADSHFEQPPSGRSEAISQVRSREIKVTTAQEIMTSDTRCVGENQTLVEAAQILRDLNVGSLPICGEDNRLKGMVTDRDIVIKCVAEGGNPQQVKAGDLAEGKPVTVGADDDISIALHTMAEHKVRRLPVIDGHDLVGMISQADIARHLPDDKIGDLVEAVSY
jgi:CBS domain-containing protein